MRSGSTRSTIAGACVGGWIAAELAVRHPERVDASRAHRRLGARGAGPAHRRSVLGGAAAQRHRLFRHAPAFVRARDDAPEAHRALSRRPRRCRCASLRATRRCALPRASASTRPISTTVICASGLHRYSGPALLLWGEHDRMVPRAHGRGLSRRASPAPRSRIVGCRPQPAGRTAGGDGGARRRFPAVG